VDLLLRNDEARNNSLAKQELIDAPKRLLGETDDHSGGAKPRRLHAKTLIRLIQIEA
jgi:hypothetical protein